MSTMSDLEESIRSFQAAMVVARHKLAMEFSSPEALKDYLHEHPKADPKKHHVKREDGGLSSGSSSLKVKPPKELGDEIAKVWKNKPSSNAVDGVRRMIEEGREVSHNMLSKAMMVLRGQADNIENSKEDRAAYKRLHDKIKSISKG